MSLFKIKLKRKFSGELIRKNKRMKKLHPLAEERIKFFKEQNIKPYGIYNYDQYENKGLYRKNMPQKRHRENPNLYEGEVFNGGGTLRQPRKCRKTAWKRFNKILESREQRLKQLRNGTI